MLDKAKNVSIAVLLIVCAYLYVRDLVRDHQHAVDIAKVELQERQALRMVQIMGNLQRDLVRTKAGKIKVVERFIPPEGGSEVIYNKDKTITYNYHRFGLTFRPGIGLTYYEGRLLGLFSGKIAYAGRYGLVINGGSGGVGFGVSRYLDDLIPRWNPKNIEGFLDYQIIEFSSQEGSKLRLGVRITL